MKDLKEFQDELFSENNEADKAFEELLKLQSGKEKPITTGYYFLDDNLVGGLNNKMVFYLSRPGMGKTHNAANIIRHLTESVDKLKILRLNLEMPTQSLLLRALKPALNKNMKDILSKEFSEDEMKLAKETLNKFKDPKIIDYSKTAKGEELRFLLTAFVERVRELDIEEYKAVEDKIGFIPTKMVVVLDHLHVYANKEDIDKAISIMNEFKMKYTNLSFIIYAQLNRTIEDTWRESKEKKSYNHNMLPSSKHIYMTDEMMQYADIILSSIIPQVVDLEEFAVVHKERNSHLSEHFIEEGKESPFARLKGLNRIYYNFIKIRMNDSFEDPRLFCEILEPEREENIKTQYNKIEEKGVPMPVFDVTIQDSQTPFDKLDTVF